MVLANSFFVSLSSCRPSALAPARPRTALKLRVSISSIRIMPFTLFRVSGFKPLSRARVMSSGSFSVRDSSREQAAALPAIS